jgi:hypothetical protein
MERKSSYFMTCCKLKPDEFIFIFFAKTILLEVKFTRRELLYNYHITLYFNNNPQKGVVI